MADKQIIDAMWDDSPVDVSTEVNFIWSIANKLRGPYRSDKYKDVIIPMTIIRRFECALAPTKQKVVDQFKANPNFPAKAMYRISGDSADVWAEPRLFQVDSDGFPTVVAGVPPDYFSATGQLWGNPLYDWKYHKKTNYEWWMERFKTQFLLSDIVRIDHFRGLESYWEIPADSETALNGKWVDGPKDEFFEVLIKTFGEEPPIIAEDLGIITDDVRALRDKFGLPGMKILQFAFEDEDSNYLPYNQPYNCVCYTGTHDNDTTTGWYATASEKARDKVRRYMNTDASQVSWDFIRTCFGSPARFAIIPVQDLFCQGSDCRMNTPGKADGNWAYRMKKELLTSDVAKRLYDVTKLYGR